MKLYELQRLSKGELAAQREGIYPQSHSALETDLELLPQFPVFYKNSVLMPMAKPSVLSTTLPSSMSAYWSCQEVGNLYPLTSWALGAVCRGPPRDPPCSKQEALVVGWHFQRCIEEQVLCNDWVATYSVRCHFLLFGSLPLETCHPTAHSCFCLAGRWTGQQTSSPDYDMEAIGGTSECSHVQQSMNLAGTTPVIGVQGRGRYGGWGVGGVFHFLLLDWLLHR